MSQVCEDYPLSRDDYDMTPEIEPTLLEAIECFLEHGLDPELSDKMDTMIEAQVDILDWAAETNPEYDPENYTCWSYDEYAQYMRETFPAVPGGFWKWFDTDEMILHFWRERKYDLVYYNGAPNIIDDNWRIPNRMWDINKMFKADTSKFYILQYGKPPVHPLQ